jgi:Zn-dependent protease
MSLIIFLLSFTVLVFSIILHEIAHGFVAERLGDPTARVMGRLTLDPRSHIDPMMSILFPLLLIFSGSPVVFGSAKPVPIDPFNFREPRKDMGLVGLAGPMTNFLIGAVIAIILRVLIIFNPTPSDIISSLAPSALFMILKTAIFYNFLLAAFNLIPIPPLDGSRILAAIIPEEYAKVLDSLEPFGFFILFFLLMFPIGGFSLGSIVYGLVSSWLHFFGV